MPNSIKPKYFPVDPTISHKIIIIAQNKNMDPFDITFTFMKSVWADEKDITNDETIKNICKQNNISSDLILDEVNSSEINNQYLKNTEEALKNNVWGSPTFIYNNELFWGQDRIEFLERAIQNS